MNNAEQPAFASVAYDNVGRGYQQDGLTKQEYFAAMAMQGMASVPNTEMTFDGLAKRSVQMADALLLALEKSK